MNIFDIFRSKDDRGLFAKLNNTLNYSNNDNTNAMMISEILRRIKSSTELFNQSEQIIKFNHPHLFYALGEKLLILNHNDQAKVELLKSAYYGLKHPSNLFNHLYINSIGSSMCYLVCYYKCNKDDLSHKIAYKLMKLAYLYLSRCIELYPDMAHDSYYNRGMLFQKISYHNYNTLCLETFKGSVLKEIFLVSDFYNSARIDGSRIDGDFSLAENAHANLGSVTIQGRDADNYRLEDLVNIGNERHKSLYESVKNQYTKSLLDISPTELLHSYSHI